MAIITLQEALDFIGISADYFTVNSANDTLIMKYNGGANTSVHIADGTYDGNGLATALKTAIDTAFTIVSTVTFSSTTYKFTITAPGANTLAYVSAASTAGLLIGFNQDHSAAVTLTSDLPCGVDFGITNSILSAVEDFVTVYCNRDFVSTTYKEFYDGVGSNELFLSHYPITSIQRLSIGFLEPIAIHNQNTYTTAYVETTSTGVVLTKDGTSSTVTFAANTTLSALVTAINLVAGWTATIQSTDYNSYASTDLLESFGKSAINSNVVYLRMPERAESQFTVKKNQGSIHGLFFPKGDGNIYVEYTAEETPERIKLAVKILVKWIYQRRVEETFGVSNYSIGGIAATLSNIPIEAKILLDSCKRWLV
jgi:hypothetical protein